MDKGTTFELEVKRLLEGELSQGDLGLDPALAQIFHRKRYFSRDRERNIIMDVSLEFYRKRSSEPYFVWILECKNYSTLVPVDDIEEFHAKLEQVGVHKTKETVVCRNGFQKGDKP